MLRATILTMRDWIAATAQQRSMTLLLADAFLLQRDYRDTLPENPSMGMKDELIADRGFGSAAQLHSHAMSTHLGEIAWRLEHLVDHCHHSVLIHRHVRHGRGFYFTNSSFKEK
jgi:hypothetical protein